MLEGPHSNLRAAIDPYLDLRRSLLDTARVRELSRLRPWRALLDVLWCWLGILAAWSVVAIWPTWWSVLLAIPIVGTRYYALFIIGHDALHRRLFARTEVNDRFADVFVFSPIGAINRINHKNHIRHHKLLATSEDPDRHKHGCFNKTSPLELLSFLVGASSLFRSLRNVFGPKTQPTTAAVSGKRDRYNLLDLTILLSWQIALIGGLTYFIGFWAWPVLWLMPVYVFAFLGDNARAFLEHSHPEPDALADQHRLITFRSNVLERQLFAPMNMNYHAAHHLWPSIPYYNLPQADRELSQLPASAAIERRGSYSAYLWRYYRAMPLTRCREQDALPA